MARAAPPLLSCAAGDRSAHAFPRRTGAAPALPRRPPPDALVWATTDAATEKFRPASGSASVVDTSSANASRVREPSPLGPDAPRPRTCSAANASSPSSPTSASRSASLRAMVHEGANTSLVSPGPSGSTCRSSHDPRGSSVHDSRRDRASTFRVAGRDRRARALERITAPAKVSVCVPLVRNQPHHHPAGWSAEQAARVACVPGWLRPIEAKAPSVVACCADERVGRSDSRDIEARDAGTASGLGRLPTEARSESAQATRVGSTARRTCGRD